MRKECESLVVGPVGRTYAGMNSPLPHDLSATHLRWHLRDGLIDYHPRAVELLESRPDLRQLVLAGRIGEEQARSICRAINARVAAMAVLDDLSSADLRL